MRATSFVLAAALVAGCSSENFDTYVGRPTTCDLVSPQSAEPRAHVVCDDTQTCIMAGADGKYAPNTATCWSSEGKAELQACTYLNECAPGLFCGGSIGCLRYCHLGDASACGDGSICHAFTDGGKIGSDTYGYCTPPACDPLGTCDGHCVFESPDHAGCVPSKGTKRAGQACSVDLDCASGLACGPQQVCTSYCRRDQSDCSGKRCLQIDGEDLSLDGEGYGYCER